MRAGADLLVRTCAAVRPEESVAIVTDFHLTDIAQALVVVCEVVGSEPTVIVTRERSIDNEEPEPRVAEALLDVDVIFLPVRLALAHTRAVRDAIAAGARVLSMTAFTERMMREGGLFTDFEARRPVCRAIAERLTEGSMLRVVNPAGTDLTVGLEGVTGNAHACLLDGPGFSAVPNIEANCAPAQGTGQGVFVCDGSIPYYGVGVTTDPVSFFIEDGFVRRIEGGEQADFLDALLARQEDPWVYNLAQFAFGLNPDCTDFTGEMLNDEGVDGTVHIGVGTSANLGGSVSAKTHFDAICREPTVWIDDEMVVEAGRVLINPTSPAPRASEAPAPEAPR